MRMYKWSDLEYLSIYFKKLKSYPDTKDNILIRTSQDEAPGALFVETKWMLLAPNVCLAFLLDSFPRKLPTFPLAKPLYSPSGSEGMDVYVYFLSSN